MVNTAASPPTFRNGPVGSRNGPVEARNSPVEARNSPDGLGNAPVGSRNGPVGSRNAPVGSRNAPVGSRNAPVGSRNAPVGSRNAPVEPRNGPVGSRNGRFLPLPPKPAQIRTPNIRNHMKNEFANRQNMHLAVLALLADPAHQAVWKDQPPVAFTTRANALVPMVNALTDLIAAQQADTTGHAADKDREEQELESAAHEISEALAAWYEDEGREADAAKVSLSFSGWQRLRDTELIARARLLHGSLTAALAENAAALADYDLSAADATRLAKETADFEALVANPAAAISGRKALTAALRPKFREVAAQLEKMDRLVLRFRKTEAGTRFADTWKATRTIRDLGEAAAQPPAPPSA